MYRLVSKLIIYRKIPKDSILFALSGICHRFYEEAYEKEELVGAILDEVNRLLDLSTTYGFDRNLWHNHLAYLLAMTETPFTLVSEKVGANEGSVNTFAENDFAVFKQLFDYDFSDMEKALGIDCFSVISHYKAVGKAERIFNKSVSEKVQALSAAIEEAADGRELYAIVTDFYRRYGVGELGLNKAFRIREGGGEILEPLTATSNVVLSDLIGYEREKQKLIDNTEAFVAGRPANNVLLFGDAGTGKSTAVKAILNEYYDRGLRMIEIYKHEFRCLSKVISKIKNRNYRFILFMDDLSFEEFETEYKYLKAVIEGGIETKPENVLIYATSNRRHLIRESWKDKVEGDDELHRTDTMSEKLSLAARFGVTIGFMRPSPAVFRQIVRGLAERCPALNLTEEELLAEANKREIAHGGMSGRTAQQFINYLAGKDETYASARERT